MDGLVFASSWRVLRRRCRIYWIALFGALPAEVLIGWPLDRLLGSDIPFLAIAGVAMATLLVAGYRVKNWPCPSCGKPFLRRSFSFDKRLRRSCAHCSLPLYYGEDSHGQISN